MSFSSILAIYVQALVNHATLGLSLTRGGAFGGRFRHVCLQQNNIRGACGGGY